MSLDLARQPSTETGPVALARPLHAASPVLRLAGLALAAGFLVWLPFILQTRTVFGIRLSNMQLLNLGLAQVNLMLISVIGAVSLNFLTGCAGLVSVGHAAFFALGAMAAAAAGLHLGLPFVATLVAAVLAGTVAGVIAGLPSLRVRGLYFVLSTMALHFIVVFLFSEYQYAFHDVIGVSMGEARLFGFELDSNIRWYFFLLPIVIACGLMLSSTLRHREGRALLAMRDNELAASSLGIDVRILRLKAFAFSSAMASLAGALQAYFLTNVAAEMYSLNFAIQFIAMIIIGGMGSIAGSVTGAIVWLLLPSVLMGFAMEMKGTSGGIAHFLVEHRPQVVNLIFGTIVALLLIFAPGGLSAAWRKLKGALRRRAHGGVA
jgi:branched-chain amino acid transport system permease protein